MEPSKMLVPSQTSGMMDIDPAVPSTPTVDAVVRSTETLGPSETFGTIGVDSAVPANPTIPHDKSIAKKRRLFEHFIEPSRYPPILRNDIWVSRMDVHWEPNRSNPSLATRASPELIRFGLALQRFGNGSPLRLILPLMIGPYHNVIRLLGRALHVMAGPATEPPAMLRPDQAWASSSPLLKDNRHAEESLALGCHFWLLCIELDRDVPYYYFPIE
ncbi:hypothetical protein BS47DRAFT_1401302 [Hydnum rufescens UP504]|uniref:Uncharacterized protein n=1 Tax=Hydnum rufescens UP504 TaxID=1448309 RepID=A0A9P6DH59_9AGAM|nr:hypothetical protein BS47DRAFT_1401302 [Hydnum rufescens UP504]